MVIKKKSLIFLFACMSASNGIFSTPVSTDEVFDYEKIQRKSTLSERRIARHLSRLKKSERTRSALRTFAKGSVAALFVYSGYQLWYAEPQRKDEVLKFLADKLSVEDLAHLKQQVKEKAQLSAVDNIPWYDRYYAKLPNLAQKVCESIVVSKLIDLVVRSTGVSFNVMDYLFTDDSLAWCIAKKTTLEPVFIEMVKTKLRNEPECERLLQLFPMFIREAEKILAFMRYSETQFHWDHIRDLSKSTRKTMHEHIGTMMNRQFDAVNDLREQFASWDTLTGEQRSRALAQQVSIRAGMLALFEDFIGLLAGFWRVECVGRKRIGAGNSVRALNRLLVEINDARKEILVRCNADEMPTRVIHN